jgi:PAS domain S-box-containing protein
MKEMLQHAEAAGAAHAGPADGPVADDAAGRWFAGPGTVRALCRDRDWSATPLGSVAGWPASLRGMASLVLAAPTPMVVLWGPDLVQVYNDAYAGLMGTKHPAGLGQPTRECWPELWDFNAPLYEGVVRRGESYTFTDQPLVVHRRGHPEEAFFTLTYSPVPDDTGAVGGVLVVVFETTEQVRAHDARVRERDRLLAESEAARRSAERAAQVTGMITTHLAEGVCMMDAEGRLTYMNPAAERVLGWTEAELRGDVLHDRVHYLRPDGRPYPIEECPLGQVLWAAQPVLGLKDQWVRKDGSFVHVVTTCTPILEDGRVAGAVLSLHDDTDRRRADAERERLLNEAERARAEAEEANRAKAQFLAVMSHELRTPLNAIGGYAELLEMGIRGPVTPEQREDLARIQTSQRHLLGLINEVLNYAKIETGAVHYDLEDVRVGEVLAAAELLVAPQARARGLVLAVEPPPASLSARADGEKLRQIVVNLLSNAVKFTDPGGRVEVSCARDGGRVTVRVRDTGIGIPADKLGVIFDPFVQVRADLTRTAEGTGLGLAISRDLARGMGGDLHAASDPGVGSTFTLILPAA